MIGFILGLILGLAVACLVKMRSDQNLISICSAIYEGYLTPDENGFLGHSRFPEPDRFPEAGMSPKEPDNGKYSIANPKHFGTVVFLDGIEVFDVIECDTAEGWLVKYKYNPAGDLAFIGNDILKEKLHGIVTVKEAE
tara:strand:- start:835 stop:1248 length:414 start_codon:yes stop_codon:yes gene_type:complete